ncbi:tetratricopeptide repeat protein [Streptomyces sp. NPDC001606]
MSDPGRSILFGEQQNPLLAAEAREMSMAFADFSFLRWITGEEDPDRAWEMYFDRTQRQVRGLLDGLLGTFPPEDHARALELARSVEAFVLPSMAVESRVFRNPGEAGGWLIGISPLVVQMSAEIAWGMNTAHPYMAEVLPKGWEEATMHAFESLDLFISRYIRALEGNGEAPPPTSMLDIAMEVTAEDRERQHGRGPRDFYDAAVAFALTHELTHIQYGHLWPVDHAGPPVLLPQDTAAALGVTDEENEELIADAATFTACFNYFLGVWFMLNERPRALRHPVRAWRWQARMRLTAWHSARRATEACEAYYSTVAILADLTFRRGDDDTSRRLMTTAARLPLIQLYVQRMREEQLAAAYGPFMWADRDVSYRKAHHRWRIHIIDDVLPATSRHQRTDTPDWVLSLRTPVDPAGEKPLAAIALAEWQQTLDRVTREQGPDAPDTFAARANLAQLRYQSGDTAGVVAALEELRGDVERALGRDHLHAFTVRHNLAWFRADTGDREGAITAYLELLADQERVLGRKHPEALDTRYELAWLYGQTGKAALAADTFQVLLTAYERALGPGHSATVATRKSLAHWRERAGDPEGAAAVEAQLLAQQEPVLSPGHPDTLAAYEARLAEHRRIRGLGHPDTLTTLWLVAMLRGRAGDAAGAAAAYQELLGQDLRELGFDEVDLRLIEDSLDHWRGRTADG